MPLTHRNWRSVTVSVMIMASKVWDDLSMWNRWVGAFTHIHTFTSHTAGFAM